MKKKYILIIILVLLLTGCTPEYNLEIKSGRIIEKLIISQIPSNYTSSDFKSMLANPKDNKFYNKSFDNNVATYQYIYDFDNVSESNILNSCYNAFKFYEQNEYYVLQTGSKFNCYPYQINDFMFAEYERLNIKIKIDGYQVIENNADSIDGNIYIWVINEKNYNNKSIFLKFKRIKNYDNEKIESKVSLPIIIIILGILIFIVIFAVFYALNLNKKRNKL